MIWSTINNELNWQKEPIEIISRKNKEENLKRNDVTYRNITS